MDELEPQSPGLDRRMVVIGGALLAAGGVAAARVPHVVARPVRKAELEKLVPRQIGDWRYRDESGLVLPPSDALSDALYSGLVTRTYAAPNRDPVMLLVAYSNKQDGMMQVHRPEVCYPAGGYKLTSTRPVEIPNGLGGTIPANSFSADGISRTEQVLYWTRVGSYFPVSWTRQRLAVMQANIDGVIPDGVLVRISTLAPDMASALPDLTAFAAALVRAAPPVGRRLLANVA
ncbi:exosortase-associated protein EpsI, V-type [uncultured Sphingomonas sp.]|uniref:exosortase-associated protein EpsI, V-type n=1 Tax=uncultured Sphingomonas sp. TaxID=158754 RepID=UPI0035CB9600